MQKVKIEPFKVIGISVRTTNENWQSAQDIEALWGRFMSQGVLEMIPNKIDLSIYSIYTNYEGDHTEPYDTILGCKVSSLENIPEGMVGQSFNGGTYEEFVAKGNLSKGLIVNTWMEIWQKEMNRTFTADFEIYREKAQNPANAEVSIFVGIQEE